MRNRVYALDFVKIIATICIVFHHYQQITGAIFSKVNFYGGTFYWGYLVELFFVISGYFTYKYVDAIKNDKVTFRTFIGKKTLRLLPMVAISVVIYEILIHIYNNVYGVEYFGKHVTVWGSIVASLGIQEGWGISNYGVNNPTWYISVLILCYVWFYVLLTISKRINISYQWLFGLMILVGIGIRTYNIELPFFNMQAARGYYAFFFGVLLCLICKKIQINTKLSVLCIVVIIVFMVLVNYRYGWVADGFNYLMTFVFYPAIIVLCHSNFCKKVFRAKIWGVIGNISYDVYIWHTVLFILMYVVIKVLGINVNLFQVSAMICFTAITFVVGTVSHFAIEKPIQKKLFQNRNN